MPWLSSLISRGVTFPTNPAGNDSPFPATVRLKFEDGTYGNPDFLDTHAEVNAAAHSPNDSDLFDHWFCHDLARLERDVMHTHSPHTCLIRRIARRRIDFLQPDSRPQWLQVRIAD